MKSSAKVTTVPNKLRKKKLQQTVDQNIDSQGISQHKETQVFMNQFKHDLSSTNSHLINQRENILPHQFQIKQEPSQNQHILGVFSNSTNTIGSRESQKHDKNANTLSLSANLKVNSVTPNPSHDFSQVRGVPQKSSVVAKQAHQQVKNCKDENCQGGNKCESAAAFKGSSQSCPISIVSQTQSKLLEVESQSSMVSNQTTQPQLTLVENEGAKFASKQVGEAFLQSCGISTATSVSQFQQQLGVNNMDSLSKQQVNSSQQLQFYAPQTRTHADSLDNVQQLSTSQVLNVSNMNLPSQPLVDNQAFVQCQTPNLASLSMQLGISNPQRASFNQLGQSLAVGQTSMQHRQSIDSQVSSSGLVNANGSDTTLLQDQLKLSRQNNSYSGFQVQQCVNSVSQQPQLRSPQVYDQQKSQVQSQIFEMPFSYQTVNGSQTPAAPQQKLMPLHNLMLNQANQKGNQKQAQQNLKFMESQSLTNGLIFNQENGGEVQFAQIQKHQKQYLPSDQNQAVAKNVLSNLQNKVQSMPLQQINYQQNQPSSYLGCADPQDMAQRKVCPLTQKPIKQSNLLFENQHFNNYYNEVIQDDFQENLRLKEERKKFKKDARRAKKQQAEKQGSKLAMDTQAVNKAANQKFILCNIVGESSLSSQSSGSETSSSGNTNSEKFSSTISSQRGSQLSSQRSGSNTSSSVLTNETLSGFIGQSPFSFKNPIFFSVPNMTQNFKQVQNRQGIMNAKKQLFTEDIQMPQNEQMLSQSQLQQQHIGQKQSLAQIVNPLTNDLPVHQINHQRQQASKQSLSNYFNQPDRLSEQSLPKNMDQRILAQSPDQDHRTNVQVAHTSDYTCSPNPQSNSRVQASQQLSTKVSEPEGKREDNKKAEHGNAVKINLFGDSLNMPSKSMTPMPQKASYGVGVPNFLHQSGQKLYQQVNKLTGCKVLLNEKMRERYHKLKAQLPETPTSKHKYKQVAREMKEKEKNGFSQSIKHVFEKIVDVPKKVHWRIILDMADFAKRESRFEEAKTLYKMVNYLQPYAYQGWLEYAKMEEECGNTEECRKILLVGLRFSSLNENLFVKAIKVEEKLKNYHNIRSLLASLKDVQIEKSWRMMLEGALFEGRCGNKQGARTAFKHLLNNCECYGPIFLEASKYEEREGEIEEAIDLCYEGLENNIKYGPLWFQYLRLYEKSSLEIKKAKFDDIDTIITDMIENISKELNWKIYVEAAQTYERVRNIKGMQKYLMYSIIDSPENLRWKLWLIASRIEYKLGKTGNARELIERCCQEVPQKQMSMALLEYAKFFEMEGNIDRARQIMNSTRKMLKNEWKIFFEAVMLEMRSGNFQLAEDLVKASLKQHSATGRLWATLIQLKHSNCQTKEDFQNVYQTFIMALNEIPKSGEVWCEGARLFMSNHPNNGLFNLSKAEKYLDFAIQFTPQYGDSFLEMIRLCHYTNNELKLREIRQFCIHAEPNYGILWFFYKNSILDNAIEIWSNAETIIKNDFKCDINTLGAANESTDKSAQSLTSLPAQYDKWIGSTKLVEMFRSGMRHSSIEQKYKIVYGFEQILPQVAYL